MKESQKIDIDKYDDLTDDDGIDLDEASDDAQNDSEKKTKSPKNGTSEKPGSNFFKQHEGNKKKLVALLIVIVLVIIGICWFANAHMHSNQQAPSAPSQSLASKGNSDSSKFKNEIAPITSAHQQMQDVNNDWRNATVNFAKKRNLKAFQKELLTINDQRTNIYNNIKTNKNELTKPILATSSVLHDGLQESYALTKNSDYGEAIKIYNRTNDKVTENNRQYKDILVDQLTKRHIQYTTNKTDSGWSVDY